MRKVVGEVVKRVWADLGEPVGGRCEERGGVVSAGTQFKGESAAVDEGRRARVSRWPAVGDWSKAAAVVVAEGWSWEAPSSEAARRGQTDTQTHRQAWTGKSAGGTGCARAGAAPVHGGG